MSELATMFEPETPNIDWTKQICGVHQATYSELSQIMPDVLEVIKTFPEDPEQFIWDVKVHMLMPGQYPCIPNWHFDNVPRVNNKQDFDSIDIGKPMYLWLSGGPLTEFRKGDKTWKINAMEWTRFTQLDEHRGTVSEDFTWRGFIRATHEGLMTAERRGHDPVRRHSQVYLDANNFKW